MSAANVSKRWIGLEAEALFEKALGRDIHFVNDADAAGIAEAEFGAAKGVRGVVLLTTLGTGIGSALLNDGVLVPNTELGHLQVDGRDAEKRASYAAKAKYRMNWVRWSRHLQRYYTYLEALFSPTSSSSAAGCRRTMRTSSPSEAQDADHPGGAAQQRGHHRLGRPGVEAVGPEELIVRAAQYDRYGGPEVLGRARGAGSGGPPRAGDRADGVDERQRASTWPCGPASCRSRPAGRSPRAPAWMCWAPSNPSATAGKGRRPAPASGGSGRTYPTGARSPRRSATKGPQLGRRRARWWARARVAATWSARPRTGAADARHPRGLDRAHPRCRRRGRRGRDPAGGRAGCPRHGTRSARRISSTCARSAPRRRSTTEWQRRRRSTSDSTACSTSSARTCSHGGGS